MEPVERAGPSTVGMAGEPLLYCDRCGYWHAHCPEPRKVKIRQVRRKAAGSPLYRVLRALFWTH